MTRRRTLCIALVVGSAVAAGIGAFMVAGRAARLPAEADAVDRLPVISPDYIDCVIPPNIAPLNFIVAEQGADYRVRIHSLNGDDIILASRSGKIVIPQRRWTELLELNRGGELAFDIYARNADGRWRRFRTVTNTIAAENIDPYVAYRLLGPVHNVYTEMGVYQRNIETYEESPILTKSPQEGRCVNCHTFVNNRPDGLILHVRALDGPSMLLAREGRVEKIDARSKFNASPAAYTSWHPSGKLAAFSANNVALEHRRAKQSRLVIDYDSDLAVYVIATNSIQSTTDIAHGDYLETFPSWSADGKYLYFSRAKRTWPAQAPDSSGMYQSYKNTRLAPPGYEKLQYDLARIGYDEQTGQWGELEIVLPAERIDRSINEARASPNGRFVLITANRFGTFPIYEDDSDLYMLDLQTDRTWPVEVNSDSADSWHCWSSNGRWIAFASKRGNGVLARIYFSYVDPDGKTFKPVLLPQKDPTFYDTQLNTYNVPELVSGRVEITQQQLLDALSQDILEVDALSRATAQAE